MSRNTLTNNFTSLSPSQYFRKRQAISCITHQCTLLYHYCAQFCLFVFAIITASGSVQGQSAASKFNSKLAPELNQAYVRLGSSQALPVILRLKGDVAAAIQSVPGIELQPLDNEGLCAARLSLIQLRELARTSKLEHVSLDLPISACQDATSSAVGADIAWNNCHVTGQGVTVAIIDSGIAPQSDLDGSRIVAWKDLVNNRSYPYDDYGHGTHVAGIVGGTGEVSIKDRYSPGLTKIAPNVKLVCIKALDQNGQGTTSRVIAGILWCIANQTKFHIRILNLSLGGHVGESSSIDPLCQVCEKAWKSGILVVCAAGNNGRSVPSDPGSIPIYGGINSPGNDAMVLTVGAINMHDKADMKCATICSYSSRGPSAVDLVAKPDLVAPGNRCDSLAALGCTLSLLYPSNFVSPSDYGSAGKAGNYFRLSGTSMAAPVVAGAAALLLQANPTLTPDTLKTRLMLSATPMGNGDPFTYGLGVLNIPAALACTAVASHGSRSPTTFINSDASVTFQSCVWDNNLIWGNNIIWGGSRQSANNIIWGDNLIWGNNIIWGNGLWQGNSVIIGDCTPGEASDILLDGDR